MTLEQKKVMYTAKTHTTGGRSGASRSNDGRLDVRLSIPGASGNGTNPEQLFAAGKGGRMEAGENQEQVSTGSHTPLGISPKARDSHFPTAPTTASVLTKKKAKAKPKPKAAAA